MKWSEVDIHLNHDGMASFLLHITTQNTEGSKHETSTMYDCLLYTAKQTLSLHVNGQVIA
jgi:hypothetical protein